MQCASEKQFQCNKHNPCNKTTKCSSHRTKMLIQYGFDIAKL